MQILVATSNENLAGEIRKALSPLRTITVDDVDDVIGFAHQYPADVIILCANSMKDDFGIRTIKDLRTVKNKTPILIILGTSTHQDHVALLTAGADNYLGTAIDKDELTAVVHALARRNRGLAQSIVTIDEYLTLDLNNEQALAKGKSLLLTDHEYRLLKFITLRKGVVCTKEQIYDHLYPRGGSQPEMKIIDVFICKLRKKIANAIDERVYIETTWGRGYTLITPLESGQTLSATHKAAATGTTVQTASSAALSRAAAPAPAKI
jgi:two-component system cell cycle response regulator CtrA